MKRSHSTTRASRRKRVTAGQSNTEVGDGLFCAACRRGEELSRHRCDEASSSGMQHW